jgi:hypothetical protein
MTNSISKWFNITGLCVPAKHYMVDIDAKIETIIREYIEPGEYFVINRARQYGKTTTLSRLQHALIDKYLVLRASFEGLGETAFSSEEEFVSAFIDIIHTCLERAGVGGDILDIWDDPEQDRRIRKLPRKIIDLITSFDRPIVLMIDEVDKSANNRLFLDFLGMLRDMYLNRNEGIAQAFHSVILAGVHDIKNLRAKIRPDSEHAYNSPWNIAASFDVDMSFAPDEISSMLAEYEADYHTGMDIDTASGRLYYHTNGYPFLVSALCKLIHEKSLGWNVAGIDSAADLLVQEANTLFDDMIKNMQRHESFSNVVTAILLRGEVVPYVPADPDVSMGIMYGIFRREDRRVVISNRIFEAYIYDYLIMQENKRNRTLRSQDQSVYIHNGVLSMDIVIERFAELMHREYRRETGSIVEIEGRLFFLCYLRPIINGAGHYYVEVQTRNNTRMDVIVTFRNQIFIVELKVWHGEQHESNAHDQLAGYVKSQNETTGYLISFCDLQKKPREGRTLTHDGVEIHETIIAYKDVV